MPAFDTERGYDLWYETSGERGSEAVVLLHGFTGTGKTWDFFLPKLKDLFVIVPDLPGHGKSGFSKSKEAMSLEATADAIAGLLGHEGVERVSVVGYSLGGRVALTFALRHPGRLVSLAIEGASPGIKEPIERKNRRLSDDALADDLDNHDLSWFVDHWEKTPVLVSQLELDAKTVSTMRRERMSNNKEGLAMSLRGAGNGRMRPLWGSLGELKAPVMLVAGEEDAKFTKVAESMANLMPRGEVKVVKGSGHAAHLEKPEEFGELVAGFLRGKRVARRVS